MEAHGYRLPRWRRGPHPGVPTARLLVRVGGAEGCQLATLSRNGRVSSSCVTRTSQPWTSTPMVLGPEVTVNEQYNEAVGKTLFWPIARVVIPLGRRRVPVAASSGEVELSRAIDPTGHARSRRARGGCALGTAGA